MSFTIKVKSGAVGIYKKFPNGEEAKIAEFFSPDAVTFARMFLEILKKRS